MWVRVRPLGKGSNHLTGAHINNNFHDGLGPGKDCSATPETYDFDLYLKFLKEHGHNFARLWRWELFRSQVGGGSFHFCASPQPWLRTGPGTATDGQPKFDLTQFDPAYFSRLRNYTLAAGVAGIYVSVMFFEGFTMHLTPPPDNVEAHPFYGDNNINGVTIGSIVDYQVLPLEPRIQDLQEAYIKKVLDTVQDLPNVLYEVSNESSGQEAGAVQFPDGSSIPVAIGDTTEWQYWVINRIKQYEREKGYSSHPVGMTYLYPVQDFQKANEPLWNSPADWISPGFDNEKDFGIDFGKSRWRLDPPANAGAKVVISDTDHYSPFESDALWAWKSFARGHNPVLYDFGILDIAHPHQVQPGVPPYQTNEPARLALGDTARMAERLNLKQMEPHGEITSTQYALANPGQEYLVFQPDQQANTFTLTIEAGTYAVEWFGLTNRETKQGENLTIENTGQVDFQAPFEDSGPAVLYLKRQG
jgi:hypothetical protein